MVLLEGLGAAGDGAAIAGKLRALIAKPFPLPGGPANVTVSVGVGLYPDDGREAEVLLKAADGAMYRSKRAAVARPAVRRRRPTWSSDPAPG